MYGKTASRSHLADCLVCFCECGVECALAPSNLLQDCLTSETWIRRLYCAFEKEGLVLGRLMQGDLPAGTKLEAVLWNAFELR